MATGETFTSSLGDSLETIIAAARAVREYEGVMQRLAQVETLEENTGLSWREITYAKLTASSVSETQRVWNPQQFSDSAFALTPTMTVIHTFVSDRVKRRLNQKALAKMGSLSQKAIERKKDTDGITLLDGASNSQPGAGNALSSGVIAAANTNIRSNATEASEGPVRCVLHGFQRKDLYDELTAGLGTYPVPEGVTARVFKEGFAGRIDTVEVFIDDNITVDSSSDAKGGVFAQEGCLLIQGKKPWTETRREPDIGGGGESIWHYDEYIWGERLAANTTSAWMWEIYSDATAPTS